MKKSNSARRVLGILLGVLMLSSLLTACGGGGLETSTEAAKAMTVTLTMIKEEGMTDDAIKLVENALNEITENKYNTHVVLQMFTAEEYADKVLEMSRKLDINDAGQEGSTYVSSEVFLDPDKVYVQSANGDFSLIDEQNRANVVYPTLTNTQLDILFIDSVKTYSVLAEGYNERPYITDLSTIIGTSDLPVAKYVNSTLLSYARRVNGSFRAIPNNYYYGDYSYMLVNKQYFDELQYDISLVSNFSDLDAFLSDISAKEKYSSVAPIYNFTGFDFLTYYEFETPLLLQTSTSFPTDAASHLNDMTRMSFYQTSMDIIYKASKLGDRSYKETDEVDFNADFAVAFLDGSHTIPEEYKDVNKDGKDDYYVINISRPIVGNEMFESMFAISEFAENKERAFEILALLQTDAEVVNLLAYGLNNVHYELDNKGVVVTKDESYAMDYKKVGNTFLCYPNYDMDEATLQYAENNWDLAKKHNEKIVISPYCGFYVKSSTLADYEYYDDSDSGIAFRELADKTGVQLVDAKGNPVKDKGLTKIFLYTDVILKELEAYSKEYMPKMTDFEAAADYESYKEYLKAISAEFRATEIYSQATGSNTLANNTASNPMSPRNQYDAFFNATYKQAA